MTLRVLLGVEPSAATTVLMVWLTYALHALVWCGAALVALSRRGSAPATRHGLWKLALLGPCVSAPLAALVPSSFGQRVVSLAHNSVLVSMPAPAEHASPAWLALGLALAASLGLLRFVIAFVRLRRRLRARAPVHDARVLQQLERLVARAGLPRVILTESAAIGSPLVLGARELCAPLGMLSALEDAELGAVLGHELAHLERGDGVWFPIAGAVQSVLWLQPLNHWLAAHFRATAELACDDRAVELTGDGMGLARALVQVAQQAIATEQGVLVPSMAGAASALRSRVERLTAGSRARVSAFDRGSALASLGVCAIASLSLSVGVTRMPVAAAGLDALLRRDRELQAQLIQAENWSEDHRDSNDFRAWKSGLERQLRHVREEEARTERRATP